MKILAIESEIDVTAWDSLDKMLEQEAQQVFQLYLSDSLREIYFTESKSAVLILETKDRKEAERLLNNLPLVKYGKIKFDIMELKPCSGFERIIKNASM